MIITMNGISYCLIRFLYYIRTIITDKRYSKLLFLTLVGLHASTPLKPYKHNVWGSLKWVTLCVGSHVEGITAPASLYTVLQRLLLIRIEGFHAGCMCRCWFDVAINIDRNLLGGPWRVLTSEHWYPWRYNTSQTLEPSIGIRVKHCRQDDCHNLWML